jgi:hypothetical protein
MRNGSLCFGSMVIGLVLGSGTGVYGQTDVESAASFTEHAMRLRADILFRVQPDTTHQRLVATEGRYSWHSNIVTTVFWIGETASGNNPVPNRASAWDLNWSQSYGGPDAPDSGNRRGFLPGTFVPHQNPFYVALPYNDIANGKTKPEAAQVVPWFKDTFVRSGQTVLKGRWVAIRKGTRACYAQWEDVGPFQTDNSEYVFGNDRPRPNLNGGAGLDVSPGVRDYLRLSPTDVTDWRFVEQVEVPPGPWTLYGDNNTFVIDRRKREEELAKKQ